MKKNTIIILVLLMGALGSYAQSSSSNNNPTGVNHLGWDDTNDTELRITQNNTDRMLFNSLPTWNGINGLTETNASRLTLGLNGQSMLGWSMLHLTDNTNISSYYQRDWFNIGTSYTEPCAFMYTGLLQHPYSSSTTSDAVIAWGNSDASSAPDNFRILFIEKELAPIDKGSKTVQGLETFRITPTGNVGIGNFSDMTWTGGAGLAQQPTHKLDVDGTVRLRQMANDNPDVLITGVEENAAGDYELQYKELSGDPDEYLGGDGNWYEINGEDCRWLTTTSGIATGYVATDLCNEDNVGIGMAASSISKLMIRYNNPNVSNAAAIRINPTYTQNTPTNSYGIVIRQTVGTTVFPNNTTYGIKAGVYGATNNFGGWFRGSNTPGQAERVVGVYGEGYGGKFYNFGVYGLARRVDCSTTTNSVNIGVYGEARYDVNCTGTQNYSGYFVGPIVETQPAINVSDEMLKDNITSMDNAMEIIVQLQPKLYNYRCDEYPEMHLETGEHCGLIAQELAEVLPNLVQTTTFPAQFDSLGVSISEEFDFQGVKYTELIPILIQATKEQQAELNDKGDKIEYLEGIVNELRQLVSQCCEDRDKSFNQPTPSQNDIQIDKNLLKQNTPNPFDLNTSIDYYLAQGGEVVVKVFDAKGKVITVLVDQTQEQGAHKVQWNAENISRGVYFYSLEINGEEMVKRMVKL